MQINRTGLMELSTDINTEHRLATNAAKTAIQHAINAGALLNEAKARVKHGEWLPWLQENCELSERTARNYMRLANLPESKRQRVADMPIRQALEFIAEPTSLVALLERCLAWSKHCIERGGQFDVADMVKNALIPYEKAKALMAEEVRRVDAIEDLSELAAIAGDTKLENLTARVKITQQRLMGLWLKKGW